jgi:hypothetical protein
VSLLKYVCVYIYIVQLLSVVFWPQTSTGVVSIAVRRLKPGRDGQPSIAGVNYQSPAGSRNGLDLPVALHEKAKSGSSATSSSSPRKLIILDRLRINWCSFSFFLLFDFAQYECRLTHSCHEGKLSSSRR